MPTSPKNNLARALRKARAATGLSQEDFGSVSGRTYISQLERRERHATLTKVDELASVIGVHPTALLLLAYLPELPSRDASERLLATAREDLQRLLSVHPSDKVKVQP